VTEDEERRLLAKARKKHTESHEAIERLKATGYSFCPRCFYVVSNTATECGDCGIKLNERE